MTLVLARRRKHPLILWVLAGIAGLAVAAAVTFVPLLFLAGHHSAPATQKLRWAFDLSGQPAPNFTLSDQFGRRRSLSSFRGKEVVLAFVDAQCTAVCPLTAEILRAAKARLAPADASRVALVAVNANPLATSTRDAYTWSVQHHMVHQWTFLTGPPPELKNIYARYRVFDVVTRNKQVEHDAAVILIDAQGREQLYFNTAPSKQTPIVSSQESAYATGMVRVLHES
jgi:cytochrome oxidase Cu insertion factor (SCO1/SenC/PrrC family)